MQPVPPHLTKRPPSAAAPTDARTRSRRFGKTDRAVAHATARNVTSRLDGRLRPCARKCAMTRAPFLMPGTNEPCGPVGRGLRFATLPARGAVPS